MTRLLKTARERTEAARKAEAALRPSEGYLIDAQTLSCTGNFGCEEKLRLSEVYLQEAQRLGHMGCYVFDVSSRSAFASPELLRIFGLDPAQDRPLQGMFIEVRDRSVL